MAGEIHQVTLVAQLGAVQTSTLLYLHTDADPSGDEELAIKNTLDAQWIGLWRAITSNTVEHIAWVIKRLRPMTRPAIVFTASNLGLVVSDSLPSNASQTISHFSTNGSPTNRGRITFAGVPDTVTNVSHLSGAHMTLMNVVGQSLLDTLFDTASDGSYTFRHYRRKTGDFVAINRYRSNPNVRTSRGRTYRPLGT